ncbi:MAG: flagellar export chaperone FliS [Rickettsiales bacterium]|nr:flagellar export chaperone FliS [Pseudomonadota bacterium]MDA0966073.1 flagellar export chaperone FliS [Pseudomonadota bacterium]MDG4544255.1 flagellar export chaperone FliS [Rickettsiales bacterium]MDG4546434.1 flagellar export chaperone FliS [Rickettsiales bacterium]MDG4548580.1 flagellar export chaperone FliS [Rickettsiales bacterium]
MAYNKNHFNAYQRASETVSEVRQVIMLYEGAINFIEQAKEAIQEQNYEKRYNLINKAIAIVTGLNSCLEFNDETSEVATALDEYYQSLDMRLLYINTNDSIKECDGVIGDLRVMLDAWRDVEESTMSETDDADSHEVSQKQLKKEVKSKPINDLGTLKDIQITV